MYTSDLTGGTFAKAPLALPVHLSGLVSDPDGARRRVRSVTALDEADVVLLRLEAGGLANRAAPPSAVAIDLVLRVMGACGRVAKHRHDPMP